MIVDFFSALAGLAADVVQKLGASGTLFLILGMLLLCLALMAGRAVLRTVLLCMKVWRRLPTVGKQVVGMCGLGFAYFFLWPFIPKTEAVLAVGVGFAFFYWGCGWNLSRRYGIDGGYLMIRPWLHHAEITHMQRGLTSAVGEATTKKNGQARRPTQTETGFDVTLEPPDGLSPVDFADGINNGDLASAVARRLGWGQVKRMTATAQTDNTVRVHVDREDMEAGEVLMAEEWFT